MLLCDEYGDAFTQLQGVKVILEGVLHHGEKDKVYRLDVDEEIVKVPGDTTSRAASPLLFRNTIVPPDYLGMLLTGTKFSNIRIYHVLINNTCIFKIS